MIDHTPCGRGAAHRAVTCESIKVARHAHAGIGFRADSARSHQSPGVSRAEADGPEGWYAPILGELIPPVDLGDS